MGLRAVTSTDGMTADFYSFDMKFLGNVAARIINEVKGVNRPLTAMSAVPQARYGDRCRSTDGKNRTFCRVLRYRRDKPGGSLAGGSEFVRSGPNLFINACIVSAIAV